MKKAGGGDNLKYFPVLISFCFIAFDVLTGWLKALATGTTNSSIMRQGLFHKVGELLAMIFGYGCEFAFPYVGVDIGLPIAGAICTYIVLMETASIVENLSRISPKLANALNKFFDPKKLNGVDEDGKTEDESRDSNGSDSGKVGK